MSITNKCFCLGFNPEQGMGFSEHTNYWPFPTEQTGVLKLIDSNNNERMIVFDDSENKLYEIGLRDAPTDSYIEKLYKDKANVDNTGGYDIPTEVKFKGDTGEYEKFYIESYSNRVFIRPTTTDNIGNSNYDTYGIPSGITFNFKMNVDGHTDITINDVEVSNEIVSQIKVEGSVLQSTLTSTQSEFRLVGRQQDYIVKDIQYNTDLRINDTTDFQITLSTPVLWLTRGENKNKELISLTTVSGYSSVDGPDTRPDSAYSISGGTFSISNVTSTNAKVFSMWLSGSATLDIMTGTTYTLENQAVTTYNTYSSWKLVYVSGITASGTIKIRPSGTCKLFDIRMYDTTNILHIAHMFDDVSKNYGDNICPIG